MTMFKQLLTITMALLMSATLPAFAEDLAFIGTTDKNPLLYDCNEKMTFTVTLVDRANNNLPVTGRTLKWSRKGDDGKQESGTATSDQPLVVSTSIDRPGFVRLIVNVLDENGKTVSGDKHKFDGGAGAAVDQIKGEPLPANFNAFWDNEIKTLYDTPYEVTLTPVDSKPGIKAFKFSITTFPGEAPATGILGYPEDAEPGSLPITVNVVGYGFGRYWVNENEIRRGRLFAVFARQGEDPIREKDYYTNLQKNELKGFAFRNNTDLRKNDFYQMLIRDVRALQYLKSRPEWNKRGIFVGGGSMGGFQAIGLAALDHDVTSIQANIAWVCDLAGVSKHQRMGGWRPAYTDILAYFDTANLATRVKCPVTMQIGLGDYVCPPSGEMVLFHNLKCQKELTARQNGGHGGSFGPNPAEYKFINHIR